jgi:hypothetical protein
MSPAELRMYYIQTELLGQKHIYIKAIRGKMNPRTTKLDVSYHEGSKEQSFEMVLGLSDHPLYTVEWWGESTARIDREMNRMTWHEIIYKWETGTYGVGYDGLIIRHQSILQFIDRPQYDHVKKENTDARRLKRIIEQSNDCLESKGMELTGSFDAVDGDVRRKLFEYRPRWRQLNHYRNMVHRNVAYYPENSPEVIPLQPTTFLSVEFFEPLGVFNRGGAPEEHDWTQSYMIVKRMPIEPWASAAQMKVLMFLTELNQRGANSDITLCYETDDVSLLPIEPLISETEPTKVELMVREFVTSLNEGDYVKINNWKQW